MTMEPLQGSLMPIFSKYVASRKNHVWQISTSMLTDNTLMYTSML